MIILQCIHTFFYQRHVSALVMSNLQVNYSFLEGKIYTSYQRPIRSVTKSATNFRTITSIDLMLRHYGNKTTASMRNPQIQLNRNSFLIFGTQTTFHDYNTL